MKHTEGEQARLIKGRPGEAEQAVFFDAVTAWAERERVTVFFFEAFDENWKGGEHPNEVEKHWGLYRADRTPKLAVRKRSFE
jgi:exo-beta-1,3-glucanase (GH17 family)